MNSLILAAALSMTGVGPQWTDITQGPYGPRQIVLHPTDAAKVMLVGEQVSVSSDGGRTWRDVPSGPRDVERVFVHPGRPGLLFAQEALHSTIFSFSLGDFERHGGALKRSVDFGETWTVVREEYNETHELPISPFASDPRNPKRIFAARRSGNGSTSTQLPPPSSDLTVLESLDDGASWGEANAGLPTTGFFGFDGEKELVGPTTMAPLDLYFTSTAGVYVSRDGAATWSRFSSASLQGMRWVKPDPLRPATLYGFQVVPLDGEKYERRLLRSTDAGQTWRTMLFGVAASTGYLASLTVDPIDSDRLWLMDAKEGLFFSADRGERWGYLGFANDGRVNGLSDPVPVALSPAEPLVVYVTANGRVYRGDFTAMARGKPVAAVEYYSAAANRFWVATDPAEALAQDYRSEPGAVVRTGATFGVWKSAAEVPGEAIGVCRFQGDAARGNHSRLLATEAGECQSLKGDAAWRLESEDDFFVAKPRADGTCAPGLVGVRRFFNRIADVNYRYVADEGTAAGMRGYGWIDQGIVMCTGSP